MKKERQTARAATPERIRPMERLDEATVWHKLDNTAHLFPVISSRKFSNVYRVAVNLSEQVDAELLQKSLEKALPWFAAFRVRLRRGLFWHYFEYNPALPAVYEEDDSPCRFIDPAQNDHFLFRVTYFANRVNLECFHALADGNGAREFLLAMLCQYLMMAHPAAFTEEQKKIRWHTGHAANTEDSYAANFTPTKKSDFNEGRAYKLKGERDVMGLVSVTHYNITVPTLKAYCRAQGVSITHYIIAAIGWAVYEQLLKEHPTKYPVSVFTPVNLRNFFESATTLNFFSNIYVRLSFADGEPTFEGILQEVKRQFEEKVTKEKILEKMSYTVGGSHNGLVRVMPLPIKNMVLRAIYETSRYSSTLGFTNMGALSVPSPFQSYITGANVMLSCSPREPFKCSAISYGGVLTVTATSTLKSMSLQKALARRFAKDGLDVAVQTNGVDYGSMR